MDQDIMVRIEKVNKFYNENHVVHDLDMDIKRGEFLTLLGPSGCGKTTTLRMIAGFEIQTNGTILVEGDDVKNTEAYHREVNTVFQNYALFPHMTIYENIAFGLTIKRTNKKEIKERVLEMLELVQLQGFENRRPDQLSGGQKQRVAIARALINRPKVLLLDEPLGALDLKLRKQMQFELKRLQRKLNITFIYVTHDQEEALTMSDRIGIMHEGRLEQLAPPREIYEKPKSKFVADFIGESNIFYGVVSGQNQTEAAISLENGYVTAGLTDEVSVNDNEIVYVSVRPENMKLSLSTVSGFALEGIVKEHVFTGNLNKTIVLLANGSEIKVNTLLKEQLFPLESTVHLFWEKEDAVIIKTMSDSVFQTVDNPVMTGGTANEEQ